MTTRASVLLATLAVSTRASDADDIAAAITPIVQKMATKYSCAVSVALKGDAEKPVAVKVAAGEISRGGRSLTTADPMVWGSITKMLTGTAVLRLVDEGHIGLQDPVAPVIDAFLAKMAAKDPTQGFAALSDLFGDGVKAVTVKDLLHMHSGIPDYDTASPGRHPKDTLRTDSYAHPNRSYTPAQLLTLPWVKTGRLLFKPGTCETWRYYNCYSSTNFLLLGLLLAGHAGVQSWEEYDQGRVLSAVSSDFDHLKFAVKGAPQAWTPVHGYDETHYNNQSTPHDVHAVAGVFGGWTASDLVGDAMDTAALAQVRLLARASSNAGSNRGWRPVEPDASPPAWPKARSLHMPSHA